MSFGGLRDFVGWTDRYGVSFFCTNLPSDKASLRSYLGESTVSVTKTVHGERK
jgi:hypothetical protein